MSRQVRKAMNRPWLPAETLLEQSELYRSRMSSAPSDFFSIDNEPLGCMLKNNELQWQMGFMFRERERERRGYWMYGSCRRQIWNSSGQNMLKSSLKPAKTYINIFSPHILNRSTTVDSSHVPGQTRRPLVQHLRYHLPPVPAHRESA